jgi:RNA polymerase sigma-70 factor (ECF subfamily)
MQDVTDEELLERARSGDARALEVLLDRHQASIYRFGVRMCRDPEDAKDVLQETLLAMARGVRDFRGASSLSTWLYTIARSFCIKKRRKNQGTPPGAGAADVDAGDAAARLEEPASSPEEAAASKQLEHALEQAIRGLEPGYREVLLLRDAEGLTAPEVAEVTGLSVQAVKSRLHRARRAVRAHVAPLLGIPSAPDVDRGACPDVLTLVSQHLEGEISSDVCAEMEKHVAGCARCQAACESLRQTLALCRASSARAVPLVVQADVKQALRHLLAPP